MPTAERRRRDAARAQGRAAQGKPEEAAEAEDVHVPSPSDPIDPHAWTMLADRPPFDRQDGQEHGPFQLRLNGRSPDTQPGEIVTAWWVLTGTASGGYGYGWRTARLRMVGWGGVEAWRHLVDK